MPYSGTFTMYFEVFRGTQKSSIEGYNGKSKQKSVKHYTEN